MIDLAFAILAVALAWNTVKKWWYRRAWRSATRVNGSLSKELDKAVKANYELQTRLNGKVAGDAYAAKVCDEWQEHFID